VEAVGSVQRSVHGTDTPWLLVQFSLYTQAVFYAAGSLFSCHIQSKKMGARFLPVATRTKRLVFCVHN
jgi:hypothetical protein